VLLDVVLWKPLECIVVVNKRKTQICRKRRKQKFKILLVGVKLMIMNQHQNLIAALGTCSPATYY
jgi:hypothetical protein